MKDGKIIARAHNLKETKTDTTKHAEIIAIQKASKKMEAWRLLDCEMYVTLEPCPMCAGAIIQSRIKKVYIGAMDEKTGACGSVLNLLGDYQFNHSSADPDGSSARPAAEYLFSPAAALPGSCVSFHRRKGCQIPAAAAPV